MQLYEGLSITCVFKPYCGPGDSDYANKSYVEPFIISLTLSEIMLCAYVESFIISLTLSEIIFCAHLSLNYLQT